MTTLRDDQAALIPLARVALREILALLVRAPTGWGKTVWAAYLIMKILSGGKRVAMVVHRRDLITQTAVTLRDFNIPFSYIAAGHHYNPYHKCFVASMPTLRNRLGKIKLDYLFVDEAHLACAKGWVEVIEYYKSQGTRIIGLSATPERLDGRPLGDVFDRMIEGPSVRWLIENGHLSKYRAFAPAGVDLSGIRSRGGDYVTSEIDELMAGRAVLAGAVKNWRRFSAGKRTIAFTPSVKRSEQLAAEFRENGIMAVALDGNTPDEERVRAFNAFADRQIDILVNCELFCAGFDLAAQIGRDVTVESVMLYRPTQSLALHLQQVGRALRKKSEPAVILDMVGNLARLGLPDDDRTWSLDGRAKKSREVEVAQCPDCFASHAPAPVCPECGHAYAELKREAAGMGRVLDEVEGELEEIDLSAIREQRKQEQAQARTLDDLVKLATARGYRSPEKWAAHIHTARQAKRGNYGSGAAY